MTTEAQSGKIGFVEYHLPDLADGDYTITVTQGIEAKQQISGLPAQFPEATLRFSVLGPRFTLDPQVVTSVFPPAGSVGDHSNVLPHIILNRSTLPWERLAIPIQKNDTPEIKEEKKKVSWLVLLLFEEGELASPLVSLVTLQGHENSVNNAQFSPDGERIVTASEDKTARLWEAERGGPLATLQGHQGSVTSAQFSPDGKRIVTASADKTARLWETDSGRFLALQGHQGSVTSAQFSPDGKRIVTASEDKTARLWEAERGGLLATLQGHQGSVTSAQFSPDGERIVTASEDKTARLWEAERGGLLATLQGHQGSVTSAQFSPDGKRIVTASEDKTARLWETDSGRFLTLQGHQGSVTNAQFSPDGKRVVTASEDKTARLWGTDSGWFLTTLRGHGGSVTSAQFSPDGKRIVTASKDKTARVWETHPLQVSDLKNPKTGEIKWPGISLESGQHENDQLSLIDVPWGCLKQIIPTGEDLRFLTHVRKTQEATGKPGEDELAVVMGSRLPKPGSISCVHLVSIEGRYKYEGNQNVFDHQQIVFDHQGAQDGDAIRLVSLKSWRFTCADEKYSFTGLLKNLDPFKNLDPSKRSSISLRLPDPEPAGADPSILDALAVAKDYLAMGCVPLPHAMRQGNKTVSWYRGPLVPGNNTTKEFPLPIRSADELVYYDDKYGMFDVSYAAAWELGRLLALQSKSLAINLYRWKRSHAWEIKDADTQLTHLHFDGPTADLELPEAVSSWFENLTLLDGVPFRYLVPDERMLPAESIRFFQIDPIWMECLVDGAFSIGRVLQSDHKQDQWHKKKRFLFEINPADCVSDLDKKSVSPKLEQKFNQAQIDGTKIELSKERCTIESREWLISNGQQKFKLIKCENNQIDVCLSADTKFLFSIDGVFEIDLNAKKLSIQLRQAFAQRKQALFHDGSISVVGWFITDNEHQRHYLVEKEKEVVKVYRDYKLPLLRMAGLLEHPSGFLIRSDVVAGWPGLQVDGYDESIDSEDFFPEKTFLFQIDPSDPSKRTISAELDEKRISAELGRKFKAINIELSKDRCAVENQQWLISNGGQEFKLIKRENNQIDVCVAADTKFLFSIDGALETDLNAAIDSGKLSTELRQAFFAEQKQVLSENSPVSVVSWFITDNEHQKHYLIQKENNILQVYREYKLPLLRMTRLSANVLICLFEGIVKTVDLHLKPETLHCGVDKSGGDQDSFSKKLKELKLTETSASFKTPDIGSNVTVSVQNSQWIARGSTILIQGAGAYMVISVPSTTSITVQNLGSTGNVPPNTQINAGAHVRARERKLAETSASFKTPDIGSNVTVSVQNSQWIARSSTILIEGAGAYMVISVPSTTSITVQNLSSTGNVPPDTQINAGAHVRPRDTIHVPLRKLAETSASFMTPDIGSNVTVSVQNSQWIARGSTILIEGAGAYMVISVPSTTSITVQNLDLTGNVPPNTRINAGAHVRARRVIDVGELAKKIQAAKAQEFSAADFTLEMIEGAEKVRFCFTK